MSGKLIALSTPVALAALLLGCPAQAHTDGEAKLIYGEVHRKFADFSAYCKLPDEERRRAVTQVTISLVSEKKISDPFVAGPAAGALLRKECGVDEDANAPARASVRWLTTAKPLIFEPGRQRLSAFTDVYGLANRIYVPEGEGPFPAVVLNHTIGGVSPHLLEQAKALLGAGYAVLLVDSYSPRNLKKGALVSPAEMVKDAYDAHRHLSSQPFIDKLRIFQSGYSLGALASAMLASPEGAQAMQASARFRATVSHYGSCGTGTLNMSAQDFEILSADIDRPVLLLMAESDIETPPKTCFPRLDQLKAAGKDIEWHIYPQTTHAWDKRESDGYVYRSAAGETMIYRYDATVTRNATARMIAFFSRYR